LSSLREDFVRRPFPPEENAKAGGALLRENAWDTRNVRLPICSRNARKAELSKRKGIPRSLRDGLFVKTEGEAWQPPKDNLTEPEKESLRNKARLGREKGPILEPLESRALQFNNVGEAVPSRTGGQRPPNQSL